MALNPPKWCSHAVPTRRGWVDPHTGEVLKAQRISDVDIQEHRDQSQPKVLKEVVPPAPTVQTLTEAPPNHKPLENMTKAELQALGEEKGLDLDTRAKKVEMVNQIEEFFSE